MTPLDRGEPSEPDARPWRSDGIEPTYELDRSRGWLLDGTIELVTESSVPIVAWAEFAAPRPGGRTILATFELGPSGGGERFTAWTLSDRASDGRRQATMIDRNRAWRLFPSVYKPPSALAHPVIARVVDDARRRATIEAHGDRLRRLADPLLDVADVIGERAIDTHHNAGDLRADIREATSSLSREQVLELLARFAERWATDSSRLYDLEGDD